MSKETTDLQFMLHNDHIMKRPKIKVERRPPSKRFYRNYRDFFLSIPKVEPIYIDSKKV